jgi:Putative beta-barrel porin 2
MKAAVILLGSAAFFAAFPAFGQGLLALSQGNDYKENVPLTLSLEAGGGYDSVHYKDATQGNTDSFFTQGGVGLVYAHNDPTMKFNVGADFDALYYFTAVNGQDTFYNSHATINFSDDINRRLSIRDNFYIAYEMQPDYTTGAATSLATGQYFYGYNNFAVSYAWSERFATTTGWTIEGIHYQDSAEAAIDDHLSNTISQQFIYKWSRRTSFVAEYRFEDAQYKQGATATLASPNYMSHYALIGVDEAWSPRLTASARVGAEMYLSDRQDKTGPYFESTLTYALSRTASIRWYNQLGYDDSELDNYDSRYSYRTGLVASKQFTERFSGNASINYVHSEFDGNSTVASGTDNEFNAGVGVDYKLWKHVTLKANYTFTTISSDVEFPDYTRNYATLLVNASF